MVIGIVGANQKEMKFLKSKIILEKKHRKSNHDFYLGSLGNKKVVVTISGIGKVNTAVTTQIMIDFFDIQKMFFIGVAGALDTSLDIGDIVISKDCIQHDVDMTAFGLKRGQFLFSKLRIYKADSRLVDLAYKGAQKAGFKVIKGRILSGDQFVADVKVTKRLRKELDGDCIEMEGAALAHVCVANRIPFVIIRHICDKADHSAKVDADSFCDTAAKNSYKIIKEMFEYL